MRVGLLLPRILLGFALATAAAATSQEDYGTLADEALAALTARNFEEALEILEHMRDLGPRGAVVPPVSGLR